MNNTNISKVTVFRKMIDINLVHALINGRGMNEFMHKKMGRKLPAMAAPYYRELFLYGKRFSIDTYHSYIVGRDYGKRNTFGIPY